MPAVRSTLGTNRQPCVVREATFPDSAFAAQAKKSSVSGVKATLLMFDEMQDYAHTLTSGSS